MTEELRPVRLTVRSASVYSLHSSKGTLREDRDKMKLHPEQKRFFVFFLGGGARRQSVRGMMGEKGRRGLGAAGAVQTKVEVEDRSVGSAVGTVQVWVGHKRLKKGRFPPPRRQRVVDPPLQLQADEKVEERGGGRAGDSAEVCRGKRRRHLLVLCVLSEAGGAQRSSVLHQNASDALHEPLGQREEREADVWVAASLGEETPVALSPFLWSHHRLAPRGARCRSAERGWPRFRCPRANCRAGGRGATPALGAQGAVPLGAVTF